MKKVILAIVLVLGVAGFAMAQGSSETNQPGYHHMHHHHHMHHEMHHHR